MRQTEASGWIVRNPTRATMRALRLAVVPLAIGVAITATGAACAGEVDDRTISEKIMDGFYLSLIHI